MERYSVRDITDVDGPFIRYEGDDPAVPYGEEPVEVGWQDAVDFFLDPQYALAERALEQDDTTVRSWMGNREATATTPWEQDHRDAWDDRRENGQVYFTVGTERYDSLDRFELEPRDDAEPHRLRNPFSIFKAVHHRDGRRTDARLGLRIARHYNHDLIDETAIRPLPDAVYDASGPTAYDPDILDELHWVQEDELLVASRNGLDEDLMDLGFPPLSRSDIAVTAVIDDPRFDHAEREIAYLFDWLHEPYFGGISPEIAAEWGRREGVDTLLGLDKTRDRKPSEYLRDSRPGYGEHIIHCDPEFYLLTTNERRLQGGELGDSRKNFAAGMDALAGFGDDIGSRIPDRRQDRFETVQKQVLSETPNLTPLLVARLEPYTAYDIDDFDHVLPGTA